MSEPKTARLSDKGWAAVMDLGLLAEGADLEQIALDSGEDLLKLKIMQAIAQLSFEAQDKEE